MRNGCAGSRQVGFSALAIGALVLIAGCSDDGSVDPAAQPTDGPTDGPTAGPGGDQTDGPTAGPGGDQTEGPTEAPTFEGASDADVQSAITVIEEMVQTTVAIGAGERPIEDLDVWATGEAYEYWDAIITDTLDQGQLYEGEIEVSVIEITQARADEIRLVTCRDVSGLDVLAEDGTSVVVPERVDRARATTVVTKREWPSLTRPPNDHNWIVTQDNVEPVPCR